jgi:hypothetical protein
VRDQTPLDGQLLSSDRLINHGRALRLERLLKLRTAVDESNRLGSEVEIVYERLRQPSGGIRPQLLRVGCDANDADLVAHGGIAALCRRYNAALVRLRELAARLAELEHHGRIPFVSGPELVAGRRVLSQLDTLVGRRQSLHMPSNVVLLVTLRREIEFFESYDDRITPALATAEQAAALFELGAIRRPSEVATAKPPRR